MRAIFKIVLGAAATPAAVILTLSAPAHAQSFDCTKARTPVERAICTQPSLGALDRAIADAFAQKLARPETDAPALRTEQTAWLRQRDAGCKGPPAQLAACLNTALTSRLAALAPTPAATPPVASATPAPAPPRTFITPTPIPAPTPLAQTPPPPTPPLQTPTPQTPTPQTFPPPAIPSAANPPAPRATIDRTSLPASAPGDTLLHVTAPGRFSIAAKSHTGTAVQLVDMMAGPSDPAGEPGAKDGRTDVLLDTGTYKLRTLPAEKAPASTTTGDVQLTVTPFTEAAPPAAIPAPGELVTATLPDLQQRAFWLAVGPDGTVQIDAVGRALTDLRLWLGGTTLVPLEPASRLIEPVRGHPMLGLRLTGKVEPGTYLVIAYAGQPNVWADGATAMPFYLRAGLSPHLSEGTASGTVGPMGSELFAAPPRAGLFRLDLPDAAAASLQVDMRLSSIAANTRDPSAVIRTPPNQTLVEVSGAAGQPYRLRAQETSTARYFGRPGRWWLSASIAGAGGDEVPPTALLLRSERNLPSRILASTVPLIAPGSPWRTQFNVRGPTTILLQNATSGELTVRNASQGLGTIGWQPNAAEMPAGFTAYSVIPEAGKQGVADLLFGIGSTPTTPPAVAKWPADPMVPFGVQTLDYAQQVRLDINQAPGLQAGLIARPAPVALAEGNLTFSQMPGVPLEIPVRLAPGGTLLVTDPAAGPLTPPTRPETDGSLTVLLPAPERPRTVVLAWSRPPVARPAIPAPPPQNAGIALGTATPHFLDLRREEHRTFDLTIPEGGLYRVETTGRLRTTATIGTAFLPTLDTAEANGIGENALLQRWLRAGRYRIRIGAKESDGHLGLQATPAPMQIGADLVPGGSIRARVPGGTGLATPLVITEPGHYKLELLGQGGRTFNARLDDAEGWPLTVPGTLTTLERDLTPGRYRLLVSPEPVDVRVVARLTRIPPTTDPSLAPAFVSAGHGPHPLVVDLPAQSTWREPAGRNDPRTPDVWTFALAGQADATLKLTDGMVADLKRTGTGPEQQILRVVGPTPWKGKLEPGAYRLETTSLGRNDRLPYTIALSTKELQPGVPRQVDADSKTPFTLAEPAVVSLTTFGPTPLKAVLHDVTGAEIARYGDRGTDWNIAISRLLPAGAYTLELQQAVPPTLTDAPAPATPPDPTANNGTDSDSDSDKPDPDPGEPAAQSTPDSNRNSNRNSTREATQPDPDDTRPELTLQIPLPHEPIPAATTVMDLPGGGVHRLTLPQPAPDHLILATAQSTAALILTIERQTPEGWRTVALDQGATPIVAVPSDTDPAPWRIAVWPVDGGTAPIRASVQTLEAPAQPMGTVRLQQLDTATPLSIARLHLESPTPIRLTGTATLAGAISLAGGWPGHALEAPDGTMVVPQSDTVWLVTRTQTALSAATIDLAPNQTIGLPIPAGGTARLASPPAAPGTIRAWRAASGLGQPGIDAGQGMGVSPGSAFTVGTAPPRIWNAGAPEILRPRVTPLDLKTLPAQRIEAAFTTVLPPGTALPLTLPANDRQTDLALAPGVAALAGHGDQAQTVWTGDHAEARTLPGAWTELLLLNTSEKPAPVSISWSAATSTPLRPGAATKRFFGAAGSLDLLVDSPPGATLHTAGDVQATFVGTDGRVLRGTTFPIPGPGRLTIAHPPGALAVWLETPGTEAWPPATPVAQAIPAQIPLQGAAMALNLTIDTPTLLRARTTAPVILTVGKSPPILYPAGAALNRYLAANTTLRIDSPHDGPLSGTLDLAADPVTPITDGLGDPVALAPGTAAVFAFQVPKTAEPKTTIGVGVRADPDTAHVRLLAANGTTIGEGSAMLRALQPGRYLIDVSLPPEATPATIRPAVVGIKPRGSGPPPEVARTYLELVGLAPKDATP